MRHFAGLIVVLAFAIYLAAANISHAAELDEAAVPVPVDVMLKPLYAPILRGRKVSHYVLLVVRLTVDGEAAKVRVSQYLPILRDRFIAEVNGHSILRDEGRAGIDFEALEERFLTRAAAVLGEKIVVALKIRRR